MSESGEEPLVDGWLIADCCRPSSSSWWCCLQEDCVRRELPPAPWGIISIKAQDEDEEVPMQPITMMRNALGKEEGGSGVPLDKEKYEASVRYWDQHVIIQM
mmetsp:Transcript_4296/g.11106  ORF Transcript_4296/g.11106 Transcript_4296/m.11106 type:complete len:102 (+) Transcript_4296:16-321(+)